MAKAFEPSAHDHRQHLLARDRFHHVPVDVELGGYFINSESAAAVMKIKQNVGPHRFHFSGANGLQQLQSVNRSAFSDRRAHSLTGRLDAANFVNASEPVRAVTILFAPKERKTAARTARKRSSSSTMRKLSS